MTPENFPASPKTAPTPKDRLTELMERDADLERAIQDTDDHHHLNGLLKEQGETLREIMGEIRAL